MNCLEFRRSIGIDPASADRAFAAHRDECPRCAEAWSRAQEFEARVASALALPVPSDLADRVLLAQLTELRRDKRVQRRYVWSALAAAACLILVIGVVRWFGEPAPPLADLVVEHVHQEPDAFVSHTVVPASMVRQDFAQRGLRLNDVPAGITFVWCCPVGPYRSVHMVMREQGQPVSVVYVTDHRQSARQDFQRDGMVGREVPIGQGTLVLLANNDHSFNALEQIWKHAIDGSVEEAAGSY